MSPETPESRTRRERPIAMLGGAIGVACALAVAFAAVALATSTVTVGSQSSSKLGERLAVDAQGHTLYALSGESRSHQFCTSAECLKFWPPLKAPSRSAHLRGASDVQGKLAILSRHGGILQVTLRGLPLYRFSGDKHRGEVNGEGIVFPGGHVWHAVSASSASHASPAPTAPSPPPMSPAPGYTTPGYGY